MNKKPLEGGDLFLLLLFIAAPLALLIYGWGFRFLNASVLYWHRHSSPRYIWAVGIVGVIGVAYKVCSRWNQHLDEITKAATSANSAILLGQDESRASVYLTQDLRTRHTQVIGTTSSGKSESVILPWAIQDIRNRAGVIIIDGKADKSFLDKIHAYTVEAGRAADFRLFSLSNFRQCVPPDFLEGVPVDFQQCVPPNFPGMCTS